jgi:hypothetical protein
MRLAGWCGIAFVVLSGVIVVVSPFWPPLGTSASEIVAYYRVHRMPFLWGNAIAIAAALPSFVQLAALVALFKRAEGDRGYAWIAVLCAAIFAHAVGVIALIAYQTVPFLLDVPPVAKACSDFAGVAFGCFLIALAGYVGLTSWATWKTRALPGWYAWLGVPIAGASLIGSLGAIFDQPAWLAGGGLLTTGIVGAFFAWCGVLAVLFLRAPEPT